MRSHRTSMTELTRDTVTTIVQNIDHCCRPKNGWQGKILLDHRIPRHPHRKPVVKKTLTGTNLMNPIGIVRRRSMRTTPRHVVETWGGRPRRPMYRRRRPWVIRRKERWDGGGGKKK